MANTIKPNISGVIPEQLPEFIQSDYPKFVAFLKAYYEYLETLDSASIDNARDLDYAIDDFVEKIKNELIYIGENFQNVDKRFITQRIKDLYLAKGNEESYKLLFRLLFNEEIDIIYPSKSIFKPSAGKWIQQNSLFVTTLTGDPLSIVGKEVDLVIGSVIEKIIVSRVRTTEFTGVYEIFLDKPPTTEVMPNSIISYSSTSYTGTIKETAGVVNIISGGKGFKVGQIIDIQTDLGNGTKLKVMKVSSGGVVTKIQIIKFGYGYRTDFNVNVSSINQTTSIFDPYEDKIESLNDYGIVIQNDYFDSEDYADFSYVGDIKTEFYNVTNETTSSTNNEALFLNFVITGINKYPGYYEGNESFPSDTIYLQDSRYYQNFSYVISSDRQLDEYKNFVSQFIHPAGLQMFGEYSITNNIDIRASVEFILNKIIISFTDDVMVQEMSPEFIMSKAFSDEVNVLDYFSTETNFIITKYIYDEITPIDNSVGYVKNYYTEYDYWDTSYSETDT